MLEVRAQNSRSIQLDSVTQHLEQHAGADRKCGLDVQAEFNRDLKQAAATALASTKPGVGLNPLDNANPWAGFDNYIDRVAAQCVNTLTPKWSSRLAAFDVLLHGAKPTY